MKSAVEWFRGRKHLIAVGFEKCGTTSLDALLRHSRGIAMPLLKETFGLSVNYDAGLTGYRSYYPARWDGPIADFTPSYFRYPEALDRIEALPSDVTILFFMRHPVRRAYSAYLHRIDRYIGRDRHGDIRDLRMGREFNFWDLVKARSSSLLPPYAAHYRELMTRFGEERVVPIVMEEMINDPNGTVATISKVSDIPLTDVLDRSFPHSNSTTLPVIRKSGSGFRVWWQGVPRQRVVGEEAERLQELAESWTHHISADDAEALFNRVCREDVVEVEALLGRSLPAWHEHRSLSAPKVAFGSKSSRQAVIEQLTDRCRRHALERAQRQFLTRL